MKHKPLVLIKGLIRLSMYLTLLDIRNVVVAKERCPLVDTAMNETFLRYQYGL